MCERGHTLFTFRDKKEQFQCICLNVEIIRIDPNCIHAKLHKNIKTEYTVCTRKILFYFCKKNPCKVISRHVTHTCVHHVVLVYSFFNDLVIALSLVIEMTAMHDYTNLMVCNYSS